MTDTDSALFLLWSHSLRAGSKQRVVMDPRELRVVREGVYPALVSREFWDKVNSKSQRRKPGPEKRIGMSKRSRNRHRGLFLLELFW